MKKLACKDMGMNCNYEVSGENDDELIKKAVEHGKRVHNLQMSQDDESKIRRQIKNV